MFVRVLTVIATLLFLASAAQAETYEIKMLNSGAEGPMVFEPAFVKAEAGDTIVFLSTDPGHNAETIEGMVPEGAEGFKGGIGEEISVTLTQEGLYGVKCLPHYAIGMVALIQVGAPVNLEQAEAVTHVGNAGSRFAPLFEQVER